MHPCANVRKQNLKEALRPTCKWGPSVAANRAAYYQSCRAFPPHLMPHFDEELVADSAEPSPTMIGNGGGNGAYGESLTTLVTASSNDINHPPLMASLNEMIDEEADDSFSSGSGCEDMSSPDIELVELRR